MATEVVKIIDPDLGSGADYDSLYDWEAAQQGDLTGVRDEIAVAKCRCTGGTADTTSTTIDGWTTSETQYIKVWTDTSESYRHNGTYQTGNKYRIETTLAIWVGVSHVRIIGLLFGCSNNNGWSGGVWAISASDVHVISCIAKGPGNVGSNWQEGFCSNGTANYIINCIAYDWIKDSYCSGFIVDGGTCYFYNCTAINCYYGFSGGYLVNCLSSGGTLQFSGSSMQYCASSDDSADNQGGSGNRINQTFSFVSSGTGDFHLQADDTGALGYGLNLYNDAVYPFQTDIDGQDRGGSGASWDIGADEFVITGSTCWGHDTGVIQDNTRNFDGDTWEDGDVSGSGDAEFITLEIGEERIFEPVKVEAGSTVTLRKNPYFARS